MNDPSWTGSEVRPSLEAVLVEYLQAEDDGAAPDPAQVMAAHPHLTHELTAFFECREVVPRFDGPPCDPEPQVGSAGFDVLEHVGRGAMGDVYKARQNALGRLVALKVLRGVHSADDRRRIRREAKQLAVLKHPNVVQIIDAGGWSGIARL